MPPSLKASPRLTEALFLGGFSLFCLGAFLFRVFYTHSQVFIFLNWNLFLAFIPWALTSLVILRPGLQRSRFMLLAILVCWLLFFPNAPYILTDLFHLRARGDMPIWYDLILILSFAFTGLLFGFLSLLDIEKVLQNFLPQKYISFLSAGLLFLSSFGIYVGRFLRWNSWDVVAAPQRLMLDVADRFVDPFSHPRTWGMTLFMGLFLNMAYFSFRLVKKREG